MLKYLLVYFLIINIFSGIIFYADKIKAQKKRDRIPESRLHILEIMGGIFSIIILMFIIRHKNHKLSYKAVSISILILWIFFLTLLAYSTNDLIIFANHIIK